MMMMIITMTTGRLSIFACIDIYTMYPVTFIDDDCIAPPDKGSYIHYIVVFAIITYTYI